MSTTNRQVCASAIKSARTSIRASVREHHRYTRIVAIVAGLLGVVCALATPLLGVKQTTAELQWPQNGTYSSVTAPLMSYAATDLTITVPCQAAADLLAPDKTVLLSTVPHDAPKAVERGLFIQKIDNTLAVTVNNTTVLQVPLSQVLSPDCQMLRVTARDNTVTSEFIGLNQADTSRVSAFRPNIVGVFTDLSGPAPQELQFSATIDTRYSSTPSVLKWVVMLCGIALTGIALCALHRLDCTDNKRNRRLLPARWWSVTALDGVVVAVLGWWHIVGANTSDDGYILTMARVADNAGYMANYYRWFGTPEAPFGWYYDILTLWAQVSTTSVWMRLPTLLMALACWWVISREVIPRLGHAVKTSRAAIWTAAGMFLVFWLPLNNGLRPEPLIALGILLTWCSVERAVATSRLLPLAIACIIGALTLFSGPTGIAAIGALLVAISPLVTIIRRRSQHCGALALLAPVLAAATVVIILIFRDQTLATEMTANVIKTTIGPNLAWFDEHIRYERLFTTTPDGSIARRFAVLALFVALAISVATLLRRGHIPGTAAGPGKRIIGIAVISFFALMLTPTKWTHHFGVFAGLAGSLGALAAVAISAHALQSRRNRAIFAAIVLFVMALSFASVNGWWYVSNFGVPWSNDFPQWHFGFSTVLLGLSIATAILAAWWHFHPNTTASQRGRSWWRAIMVAPLAMASWLLVIFEVLSLTLGMAAQWPAWSVGRSNLHAVLGAVTGSQPCGLADDVLVEIDPYAGMLAPIGVRVNQALRAGRTENFTPTGVPPNLSDDRSDERDDVGPLPYGLDPARTVILGSWRGGVQLPARLQSAWYELPQRELSRPLLVVSAAGKFNSDDITVQWATDQQAAQGQIGGSLTLADVGAAPQWRNLRVPMEKIPDSATRIRLVVVDNDMSPQRWIALTPPRVPVLNTLAHVVGSHSPVLLDWLVGLAFPCQRPYAHHLGVMEMPQWRILPDHFGAEANSPVMDAAGGGPLGIIDLLYEARTVPSYLKDDWTRDWGSLQQLRPLVADAQPAHLNVGTITGNGWQ